MAHYRKIDTRIWNDAKFYELAPHAKLVFIGILTHPNMTGLGVMRASEESLAADLNMELKAFGEAFREVFRKGLIKVSERPPVILVPRFLKYNKPESPNVVRGWAKVVDMVPESDLLFEALDIAKANVCSMPKAFTEAFTEAIREVFRKTSLNQRTENREQRTEKETACAEQTDAPLGSGFLFVTQTGKWELSQDDLDKIVEAHPKLDVPGECRRAALWLEANPTKRKTDRGMLKFLTAWLMRANNPPNGKQLHNPNRGTANEDVEAFMKSWRLA